VFKLVNCSSCETAFNVAVSPNCPKCKTKFGQSESNKSTKNEALKLQKGFEVQGKSIQKEIDPIVLAQNRTTHAVRALAIMLVAAPLISFIVGIALIFSLMSENWTLIFFVSLLGLIALIKVILNAVAELDKSKIS